MLCFFRAPPYLRAIKQFNIQITNSCTTVDAYYGVHWAAGLDAVTNLYVYFTALKLHNLAIVPQQLNKRNWLPGSITNLRKTRSITLHQHADFRLSSILHQFESTRLNLVLSPVVRSVDLACPALSPTYLFGLASRKTFNEFRRSSIPLASLQPLYTGFNAKF